jgi:hypothetical protein
VPRLEKGGYSKGINAGMEEIFQVFPVTKISPLNGGEATPNGLYSALQYYLSDPYPGLLGSQHRVLLEE